MPNRRHIAEIVASLPNDLNLQMQGVCKQLPALQQAIEANSAWHTVKTLVDSGHKELGLVLADMIEADLQESGRLQAAG